MRCVILKLKKIEKMSKIPNLMEPRCRICARLTSTAAFDPHTLKSRYKSPAVQRDEYCDPRCNAKVGIDIKSKLDSRSYHVDRLVNKLQELNKNVHDLDESMHYDTTGKNEQRRVLEQSVSNKIVDLKSAHSAVQNCLREMDKVKTFLEDENSWWKILKDRSTNCCQRKRPHLHGVLEGSSVTLILTEEGTDKTPHDFMTSTPKKRNGVVDFSFRTSPRGLTSAMKHTEQRTGSWEEQTKDYAGSYAVPCYSFDAKLTSIELTNDRSDRTQRYAKTAVRSKQDTIASDLWTEVQEDRSDEQRKLGFRSSKTKETRDTIQSERKEKPVDRSNSKKPPKETWYGQNEDTLRPRETFSSENTGNMRNITADFESNVDLDTELPSKNIASHKPRTKTITEKTSYYIQKFPIKNSRSKSRN